MGQLTQVRKALTRIPAAHTSPGGAEGLKRLRGAGQEAAQSQWKRRLGQFNRDFPTSGAQPQVSFRRQMAQADRDFPVKKFASRDQNSSIGTTISWAQPNPSHKAGTTTAQTRSGSFAGKTRGVGRHLTRDENSSPGSAKVRTPTLREINGKFAGQGQGVKVFHPGGKRGSVHSKTGVVRVTKGLERKGMLEPVELVNMQFHTGARVGRRITEADLVSKAGNLARYGGALERMASKHPQGSYVNTHLRVSGIPGQSADPTGLQSLGRTGMRNANYSAIRAQRSAAGQYGPRRQFGSPRELAHSSSGKPMSEARRSRLMIQAGGNDGTRAGLRAGKMGNPPEQYPSTGFERGKTLGAKIRDLKARGVSR